VVARVAVPFRKVTVPVGVPVAGGMAETVAVKVTDWPNSDGLRLETSPVAALLLLTVWLTACVSGAEVALVKLELPE
jgi:hypothetical protein